MAQEDEDLPGNAASQTATVTSPPPPPAVVTSEIPAETTPAKHRHSAQLRRIGTDIGFSEVDFDTHSSDEIWAEINRIREFQFEERRRSYQVPREAAGATVSPPPPPPDPLDAFNAETHTPELLALAAEVKRLRGVESKVNQFEQSEQVRAARSAEEAIDLAFESVAKDYPQIGELSLAELKTSNVEAFNRRLAIYRAAGVVNTDSPRMIAQKIAATTKLLLGAKQPTPAVASKEAANGYEQPAKPTGEQYANGQVARPTSRNGSPEPKGRHAAVTAVANRMRERGEDPGVIGSSDENDDLPE